MREDHITFKTAKLAEERGYRTREANRHPHKDAYTSDGEFYKRVGISAIGAGLKFYEGPTQDVLRKWLRNEFNIFVEVHTDCTTEPKFWYLIRQFKGDPKDLASEEWEWLDSVESAVLDREYETALEYGLQEALKLIP